MPEVMDDRDEWRERVREIRSSSAIYIYIYICVCVCVYVCVYARIGERFLGICENLLASSIRLSVCRFQTLM